MTQQKIIKKINSKFKYILKYTENFTENKKKHPRKIKVVQYNLPFCISVKNPAINIQTFHRGQQSKENYK